MMAYWVTGGAVSPDGRRIALSGHNKLWLISHFDNKKISKGHMVEITLPHTSHKAGICFYSNDIIYLVDELEFEIWGGKIYRVDLRNLPGIR